MYSLENAEFYDYGQKPCYKCGSKARVRTHEHPILHEVYDVCCSNTDCGQVISRNHVWRHNAVDEWNRKPSLFDLLYDCVIDSRKNNKKEECDDMKATNTPIRKICIEFNLTQRALSEQFGIPLRTVEDWSAGRHKCPEYVIRMIRLILEKGIENKE